MLSDYKLLAIKSCIQHNDHACCQWCWLYYFCSVETSGMAAAALYALEQPMDFKHCKHSAKAWLVPQD